MVSTVDRYFFQFDLPYEDWPTSALVNEERVLFRALRFESTRRSLDMTTAEAQQRLTEVRDQITARTEED